MFVSGEESLQSSQENCTLWHVWLPFHYCMYLGAAVDTGLLVFAAPVQGCVVHLREEGGEGERIPDQAQIYFNQTPHAQTCV